MCQSILNRAGRFRGNAIGTAAMLAILLVQASSFGVEPKSSPEDPAGATAAGGELALKELFQITIEKPGELVLSPDGRWLTSARADLDIVPVWSKYSAAL